MKIFNCEITIKKKEMAIGCMLVVLGIVMPCFFHIGNIKVYEDICQALSKGERIYIIQAAFKLVLLNSVRSFPHYLGTFFIEDAISFRRGYYEIRFMKAIIVCGIIPLVYIIIEKIYNIRYDFGITAILVITMLIILEKIDFNMVNIGKKILMVAMIIMTFQWLDVIPFLSGHSFGRGETSNDIKNAAILLGGDVFLQYTALIFFFLFLLNGILLCKLIRDENNLRLMSEINERNQQILMESNMRVMENRTYMELKHLVHDLKSPLTSVQALVGVVKLGSGDEKQMIYLDKIETSVERMSSMISEILYENKKSPISTYDMFTVILSQISGSEYINFVKSKNLAPNLFITVNKIRFSRAIINLLENAYYAIDKITGKILITIDEKYKDGLLYACIKIQDNGSGISLQQMKKVWNSGYSTRDSLGLGLGFVKKVIEGNCGFIDMESIEGKGTLVTINIPAEYLDDKMEVI